jgi:hypothetical protein
MKSSSIVGILLIIVGIVAFAYQGITYTTQKRYWTLVQFKQQRKSIRPFLCLPFWVR